MSSEPVPWRFEREMQVLEAELARARERWKRLPESRVRLRMQNVLFAITDDAGADDARARERPSPPKARRR